MTTFNLFTNCSFCQSRIGSTHCLLPFQLTEQYVRPQDDIAAIIDITEIHTTYGIHALKSNFEIIHWIKNRPTTEQIQEYSQLVQSRTQEWYFKNEYLRNLSDHEQLGYTNSSCQTDDSSINQDRGVMIEKQKPIKKETETQTERSDEKPESFTEVVSKWKQRETLLESPSIMPEHEKGTKTKTKNRALLYRILTREEENHLTQDLLLAVRIAYSMHSNQKSGARIDQLCESLIFEIGIKNATKKDYRPSYDTSLDGSKSIAKEIVARHSSGEMKRWEEGEEENILPFCIFSFEPLKILSENHEYIRIEDAFLHYFNSFNVSRKIDEAQKRRILNSIEFELLRTEHKTTFSWLMGRLKFLKFEIDAETTNYKFIVDRQVKERKGKEKSEKLPYPEVDQKLIDHIDAHLQVYVNQSIEEANGFTPTMKDETKLTKFIFLLASEFLRRNKGWHNENSFTQPIHLNKIEDLTGLKSQPSEAILTFNILKDTIDRFRKSYKLRYPKQIPTLLEQKRDLQKEVD